MFGELAAISLTHANNIYLYSMSHKTTHYDAVHLRGVHSTPSPAAVTRTGVPQSASPSLHLHTASAAVSR